MQKKQSAPRNIKKAENDYNYYLQKKKLTEQILSTGFCFNKQQLIQAQTIVSRLAKALAVMRQKVGDLIVRAPVDGQLTSFDAEVGQNKNKGERLGQIDVMGGFKVRVDVDEHYISRIYHWSDVALSLLLTEIMYLK